jgi:hypothetical protein
MATADTLRQGAWYVLEQAGRSFHAAAVLADDGDPITGAGLAMFGREELGRSRILRVLADRVDSGWKSPTFMTLATIMWPNNRLAHSVPL